MKNILMMNKLNEIKKELYKQKPIAVFDYTNRISEEESSSDVHLIYKTNLNGETLEFWIPEDEGKDFPEEIESQLLIRWLDDE